MKSIEMSGKNVDEAVNSALNELNLTRDKVEVEILDEGSKGLFNLIGTKPAKVKVTVKKDFIYDAKSFVSKILNCMNLEAEVKVIEKDDVINIDISGPDMGILIGYRGETLDALQYLVSLAVNKNNDIKYKRVVVDTENYRSRREDTLKRLASKMAEKVRFSGKSLKLEPMNPYERRIIHSSLQNHNCVYTYSEGVEPYRRVVIDLKKA